MWGKCRITYSTCTLAELRASSQVLLLLAKWENRSWILSCVAVQLQVPSSCSGSVLLVRGYNTGILVAINFNMQAKLHSIFGKCSKDGIRSWPMLLVMTVWCLLQALGYWLRYLSMQKQPGTNISLKPSSTCSTCTSSVWYIRKHLRVK